MSKRRFKAFFLLPLNFYSVIFYIRAVV